MKRTGLMASTATIVFLVSQAAMAQADQPAATESMEFDDIVVTARLREETLQSIPLAISALSAKAIERQGVVDMTSLASVSSGLQIDSTGGKSFTSPVIRGLSQASRIDDENNTPVFIDGVYVSGRDGIDAGLLDVERIEVVKGPQSALYGRNSYAGSINYITRKPTKDLAGSLSATFGDRGRRTLKGSISGPLIDDVLFARFGAAHDEWNGSFGRTNGLRIGGYNSDFLSGGLRLVKDDFEAVANVYYSDDLLGPSPQVMFAGNCELIRGKFGAFCGAYPTFKDPDMSGYDSRAKGLERQTLRTSLTLTQQLESIKLTSITGYNRLRAKSLVDWERQYDGLPYNYTLGETTGTVYLTSLLTGTNTRNYDISQEFRVESTTDSPLQWIGGVSYYGFRAKSTGPYAIDTSPVPDGATLTSLGAIAFASGLLDLGDTVDPADLFGNFGRAIKKTKAYAGFGAVQYTFNDVTARVELRYTSEQKSLQQIFPSTSYTKKTFHYWTPRFTLDYKPSDSLLVYASVAKGAKSGGFNSAAPTPGELPFGPEFNWTYEIGLKSDFLDKKLQFNLSVFDVEMKGIQITAASVNAPATFITQNAGTGRSRGFEVELLGRPAPGLTVQAAYSLADAQFKTALDGSLRSYPSFAVDYDVSGNPLPRQAKHLVNGYVQYEGEISENLSGYIRADGRYESRKNGFSAPELGYVKGRFVANAKAGVIHDGIEFSVWVRNLFNDKTTVLANNTLNVNDLGRLPVALLPDFRTMGATLSYKF